LIYVEGSAYTSPDILSREQFQEEKKIEQNWEQLSAGEEYITFNEKLDMVDLRKRPNLSMFDKNKFLQGIFPSLKLQKPGYDIYARTTFILILLFVYVFMFFSSFTVSTINSATLTTWASGQSEIFKTEMALLLIWILFVIIIERYSSRTDTKEVIQQRQRLKPGVEKKSESTFFTQDEIFQKASTMRSMTVRLKTMKTGEVDMSSSSV
jgi:hypothetical protein